MSIPSIRSRAIPLSPASPPSEGLKETKPSQAYPNRPRSPQSPSPSMNITTQHHDPPHNLQQTSSTEAATYPQSSSTPSTVQSSTQPFNSNSSGIISSETPASSIDMSMADLQTSPVKDRLPQEIPRETPTIGKRLADEMAGAENPDETAPPRKRPRTSEKSAEGQLESNTSPKPQSQSQSASEDITLEQIQKDMGTAFLLCRKPKASQPSHPNPSQSFMSLYGLTPLVATVARDDPDNPGEKLNKLRKSYDGQIKDFGLAGRNKSLKKEADANGFISDGMKAMLLWPDQEWQLQKVNAKSIQVSEDLQSKLSQALKLEPGIPRNHKDWEDKLGHEKAGPRPQQTLGDAKKATPSAGATRPNGVAVSAQQSANEASRPRRVKKRSYHDNAFAGYGEGFVDDQDDDVSGDDDDGRGPGRKRRKKDSFTTASPITVEGDIRAGGIFAMNR